MIDEVNLNSIIENKPMRVLMFIGGLSIGGAERQFIALAVGLKQIGVEVEVMLNYSGGYFLEELERSGIRHTVLHLGSPLTMPVYLFRAIKVLRRYCPDIVYGFMGAGVKATVFKFIFPRFKTIWGVRSSNIEAMQKRLALKISGWIDCLLSRYADAIIYNSHAGMSDRKALGWINGSSFVISNGIDYLRFIPSELIKKEVRKQFGLEPEHIVLGMLSRLDPMKDHHSLLHAFALQSNPRLRLILTCELHATSTALLREKAVALGVFDKIIWAGHDVKSERLLNALDIYVQSSAYGEGFPNAIGEAMSIGLPVVSTDVGDCRLIVGNHGRIVPPLDSKALSDALQSIILELPHWRGQASRRHIIDNYGIDKMVISTLAVFKEVCGKKQRI